MSRSLPLSPVGLLVTASALLLFPGLAHALRCNGRLVSQGDPGARLQAVCGAPDQVQRSVVFRTINVTYPLATYRRGGRYYRRGVHVGEQVQRAIAVETWTYNFGRHRLMHEITLEDGRVVGEHTLGRGYDPPTAPAVARWPSPRRR